MNDPWRYRCASCGAVSLLYRSTSQDYRCKVCGHEMASHERVDAKAGRGSA